MDKHIALGQAPDKGIGVVVDDPQTVECRIALLEEKLDAMTKAFLTARRALRKDTQYEEQQALDDNIINKDGIPTNICLVGTSQGVPYIMSIDAKGRYVVAGAIYNSLSAAAEDVSGVRRSGWTFWKLMDGRTVKEVYRK